MSSPQSNDTSLGGDWVRTTKGVEAFDRWTQAIKNDKSVTLDFFMAAFQPIVDADGNEPPPRQCIDIGCGPGSFTLEHLLPRVPAWCEKLVAVDNSQAMLQLAREKYAHPNIEYKCLDITVDADVATFIVKSGQFPLVYSLGALHWIRDQQKAMRNIATLMAPGGECFVTFPGTMMLIDIYVAMMESSRWTKYSEHLKKLVPVTHGMDVTTLRSYANSLVSTAKLVPLTTEVFPSFVDLTTCGEEIAVHLPGMESLFSYPNIASVEVTSPRRSSANGYCVSSNPVYRLLPDHEKEELKKFTCEFIEDIRKRNDGKLIADSQRVVIHASKPLK
ncbi:uncharacterized protein LOC144143270 [Haemaphysalis longicornis]